MSNTKKVVPIKAEGTSAESSPAGGAASLFVTYFDPAQTYSGVLAFISPVSRSVIATYAETSFSSGIEVASYYRFDGLKIASNGHPYVLVRTRADHSTFGSPFIGVWDAPLLDEWRVLTFATPATLTDPEYIILQNEASAGSPTGGVSDILELDSTHVYVDYIHRTPTAIYVIASHNRATGNRVAVHPQEYNTSTRNPLRWAFASDKTHIFAIRKRRTGSSPDPFPFDSERYLHYGTVDDWSVGHYDVADPHIVHTAPYAIRNLCVNPNSGDVFLLEFGNSNEVIVERLSSAGSLIQTYSVTTSLLTVNTNNNGAFAMCASGNVLFLNAYFADTGYINEIADGIWMIDIASGAGVDDPAVRLGISGGAPDEFGGGIIADMASTGVLNGPRVDSQGQNVKVRRVDRKVSMKMPR